MSSRGRGYRGRGNSRNPNMVWKLKADTPKTTDETLPESLFTANVTRTLNAPRGRRTGRGRGGSRVPSRSHHNARDALPPLPSLEVITARLNAHRAHADEEQRGTAVIVVPGCNLRARVERAPRVAGVSVFPSHDGNDKSSDEDEMVKVVKVVLKIETADHDGYCSGNECKYSCSRKVVYDDLPSDLDADVGDDDVDVDDYDWGEIVRSHTPYMSGGSGYCSLSYEADMKHMECHQARVSVRRADVVLIRTSEKRCNWCGKAGHFRNKCDAFAEENEFSRSRSLTKSALKV